MTVTLTGERKAGSVNLSTKKGQLMINETYHYFANSDNPADDRADVLAASGLPIPYVSVSPSGLGICISTDCERHPSRASFWEITAKFSTDVEITSGGTPGSDPLTWVPLRETYLEPYEEALLKDKDGKPYVNGAGLPYESTTMAPRDAIRWEFFQFEDPATVTDEAIADRNNTTNNATYKGRAKDTLLLKVRRSVVGFYYGVSLRLSEYSLTWKDTNWHDKLANYGETFRYDGKVYPYRYKSDPDTIVKGPLGIKDYLITDTMDVRGGLPTGTNADTPYTTTAVEIDGDNVFARPTSEPRLYFIERRKFNTLNFASILRI
jgi:hypothetical protein